MITTTEIAKLNLSILNKLNFVLNSSIYMKHLILFCLQQLQNFSYKAAIKTSPWLALSYKNISITWEKIMQK